MGQAKVVRILMRRDGISKKEAQHLIDACVNALEHGDGGAIEAYLGLEDDYIFDILGYGGDDDDV